jgi:pimeloyl-ACP methyl ester carboxylesterase/membrane protein DedA with SNARE-associated domain
MAMAPSGGLARPEPDDALISGRDPGRKPGPRGTWCYHRPLAMSQDSFQPPLQSPRLPSGLRRAARYWWLAYLLLLTGSHLYRWLPPPRGPAPLASGHAAIDLPAMGDDGPIDGRTMRLAYMEWGPVVGTGAGGQNEHGPDSRAERPPILLLHGSPGAAKDFDRLGARLAAGGYRVIAPDLPGFGSSSRDLPSYSIRAHARAVLALLDRLHVERVHVVGWSLGGGVVLTMADTAPERFASLTMMAAVGDQATEGSGSYGLEHLKYAVGYAIFVIGPELIPHFGLLDDHGFAHSFLRNFLDSDQRPLRGFMERLTMPVLILHGRHDFLVPDWAAEEHYRIIPTSKLVMLDASHFLPFLQPAESAEHILEFTRRHDSPDVAPLRCELSFAPRPPHVFGIAGVRFDEAVRAAPWWLLVALVGVAAARWPYGAMALVTVLVLGMELDYIVGTLGLVLGWTVSQAVCIALGRRLRPSDGPGSAPRWTGRFPRVSAADWSRRFQRRGPGVWLAMAAVFRPDLRVRAPMAIGLLGRRAPLYLPGVLLGACLWTAALLIPCLIVAAILVTPLKFALGAVGVMLLWLIILAFARNCVLLFTWTGRRQLVARVRRLIKHEYWPTWFFYIPVVPYMAWLTIRYRHPLAFTACNPGIDAGGGVVGESKSKILASFTSANGFLLETFRIDPHPSPEHRAQLAAQAMARYPALSTFPVILKPDTGFRGFGVRLARSHADILEYLREMTRPVVLQAYHPGPHEVGVLWSRRPAPPPEAIEHGEGGEGGRSGFIYSITRKDFPYVVGDGRRTLEQLIYSHRRLRCQAPVFLHRFADEASRVPPPGERVRLAQSGNHCQGTLFRDGSDLITPELAASIDELARGFAQGQAAVAAAAGGAVGEGGVGGLDFGRFDVRFASEDDLRAGRGFGIVELNGTTGESTNLYDPDKSLLWSYRVLFGQWRLLYQLGARRRRQGVPAMSVFELLASLRRYYRKRPGSPVAD